MKNKAKKNKSHIAVYIVLLSGVLITLLPFLWMLLTSLKTQSEAIHVPPVIFPAKPVLSNYTDVFKDVPFIGNGVSEDLFRRGICLPSGAGLDAADLERIASALTARR